MRGLIVVDGVVSNIAKFKDGELPDGWETAPDSVAIGWLDNGDGTFSKPDSMKPTLEEAKAEKEAVLHSRFVAEIAGVYSSPVIGTLHHYDLGDPANRNLVAQAVSATEGRNGKIKCTPDGQTKARRVIHTAEQISALNNEINDWIDGRYDHLDTLLDQVEAVKITVDLDTALAEIAAITWE